MTMVVIMTVVFEDFHFLKVTSYVICLHKGHYKTIQCPALGKFAHKPAFSR